MVRVERGDAAGDDGLCGEDEFVVGVDGVDELAVDGLADLHGQGFIDLNWQRSVNGDSGRLRLAVCSQCREQKRYEYTSLRHLVT
ncbi:hypothetical protein GCM10011507_30730 [Edaphobacter acidisoli]|uniref:Uncharacterized protein n=1 Tax=Edaphobacter acidisoli TaxID=2040573 RepID=A0A916RZP3_9BACT|nr:hypothetical protein GCM10011507_30730 [Edaphobacter acidisoli]